MASTFLSAIGPLAATFMLARTMIKEFLPEEFQEYICSTFHWIINYVYPELTIVINEFHSVEPNHIYEAAESYLATKLSESNRRLKAGKPKNEKSVVEVAVDSGEEIIDFFHGVQFKWHLVHKRNQKVIKTPNDIKGFRSFEVRLINKHRDMAVNEYLPYVVDQATKMKEKKRILKIHTPDFENVRCGYLPEAWISVNLEHPATFETLAMDEGLKKTMMGDLERFVRRQEYYKRVGKTWKRGYLVYGPPGTGKSSLIAAMANFLHFDVYDLDLTGLSSNADLRNLMLATENRSILVVEDIDCTIDLNSRKKKKNNDDDDDATEGRDRDVRRKGIQSNSPGTLTQQVTLSGMLNFMDGLWSSLGHQRIIVFTTNHKEGLDPALLRPGRMDMHIHMSYCTASGFRTLATNYLEINDHILFEEIEGLVRTVDVTPAEVSEQLMKSDEPETALRGLIEFLKREKEKA